MNDIAEWLTFPERFAQRALGHNSKAVHHTYARNAGVTVMPFDNSMGRT
jgi:hypothetical protein